MLHLFRRKEGEGRIDLVLGALFAGGFLSVKLSGYGLAKVLSPLSVGSNAETVRSCCGSDFNASVMSKVNLSNPPSCIPNSRLLTHTRVSQSDASKWSRILFLRHSSGRRNRRRYHIRWRSVTTIRLMPDNEDSTGNGTRIWFVNVPALVCFEEVMP